MSDPLHPIKMLIRQHDSDQSYECTKDDCEATTWFVKELKAGHWQLGYQEGQSSFQVAANKVICPLCATPLLISDEARAVA